jgi:hypothetical protein
MYVSIYTFLVESMLLTYNLMNHPHIYVFGGVHVADIHLDVSSTYIRFWWVPCRIKMNYEGLCPQPSASPKVFKPRVMGWGYEKYRVTWPADHYPAF